MAKKVLKTEAKKEVKKVIKKVVKKEENTLKTNFSVIEVTGNQYIVEVGKEYTVKNLNIEKGKKFVCDKVLLMVNDGDIKIGKPYISGFTVECEISGNKKGPKVDSFRYTAKSRFRKRVGSRQLLTKILIKKFVTSSK